MAGTPSLFAGIGAQFFDNSGNVLTGGKIFSYEAGTTTPTPTYTTEAANVAHPNPIILDASGRVPSGGEIWLKEGTLSYFKFVLKDANDVLIATYDYVPGTYSSVDLGNTSDPTKGDALVGFRQSNSSGNLVGSVGKTVHQKFQEFVSVKDFGAVGDGVTDDRDAIQAAITHATTNNIAIYVPSGTYYIPNNKPSLSYTGNLTMFGDGMYSSILYYNDSVQVTRRDFITSSNSGNLNLRDLCLSCDWGANGNYTQRSQMTEIYSDGTGNAVVTSCRFTNSRYMSLILVNFNSVTVNGCNFENGSRDGCRIIGSQHVTITSNKFTNINDDSIAVHTLDSQSSPAKTNIVVSNNNILNGQGIAILGGKNVTITGNVLTRPQARGIFVGQWLFSTTEGSTPVTNVNITGNTVTDVFRSTAFSLGGNDGGYIQIAGFQLNDIGNGYVNNADGSGGVLQPFDYLYENNLTSLTQIPGNWSLIISNNVCMRTLNPVAAYSDYGFGVRLARQGPSDPAITYASFDIYQIRLRNYANGALISNNIISGGTSRGIFLESTTGQSVNSWDNVSILNNQILNISNGASNINRGIHIIGKGIVKIDGNLINMDPYCTQGQRGANGTWGAGFTACPCIDVAEATLVCSNNTFKNAGTVFNGVSIRDHIWQKNTLICNPTSIGYNPANVGIGNITAPQAFDASFIIEDGNPSSATYNTVLNVCATASTNLPTTGKYVEGLKVEDIGITVAGAPGSQYTSTGWLRLTTGSSHVLNTDWVELRTLTGT